MNKVIHIHLFILIIHDGHAVKQERKDEGWDKPLNPRKGAEENGEGKKIKFLRLPGLSSKATATKVAKMQ